MKRRERFAIATRLATAALLSAGYLPANRRKRILLDGDEPERLTDAVGCWLAVVFLPGDVEQKLNPWMQPIHDALELLGDLNMGHDHRRPPN